MRLADRGRINGPVPAVDRAVVQRHLVQPGSAATFQRRQRILVIADRQERWKVPDVLLEQVKDRGNPAFAEPDSRADSLLLEFLRPGVGRLLETMVSSVAPASS